MERLTVKEKEVICRAGNCVMEEYMTELLGVSYVGLKNLIEDDYNSVCDICPFREVYNRLADYEDKYCK